MELRRRPDLRVPSRPAMLVCLEIGLLVLVTACSGAESRPGSAAPAAPARPGPATPIAAATAIAAATPMVAANLAPVGATEPARVVRVVDGDTIVIDRGRGDERLRYIGMDTPESVKPDTPVEFMAKEASAANAAMVAGRDVVLERDVSNTDRYDRLLRYVWLREGDGWVFVNLELVRRGFAQVATYPPDVRWTDTFLAAEREARTAGLGLWGPVTPAP